MDRILMIGAGIGQLFLSYKIKARGYYLIVITQPGPYPVIDIADKVIYEDVFNKEKVLEIAKNEHVTAVISDQNDMMMPTVSYIAENLNIPGNTVRQTLSYCNKNIFRDNCDKLSIPVPRHIKVTVPEQAEGFNDVAFPWVVKPADAQSSVGVSKVNDIEEYNSAIRIALSKSKSHEAILEEFFDGQEVVAEGFIYKGKYYNIGFADRKYFSLNQMFIPAQTIFPSNLPSHILDQITQCESRMAEYIKPEFAIVHSEYLVNVKSDKYKIVESALRGGGVYISSHLIPLYSGVDINEILIDCMVGKRIDPERIFAKIEKKASAYICFYLPHGKIIKLPDFEKISKLEFVKMVTPLSLSVGDSSPILTHKGQRLGPIIVSGKDRKDIEENIRLIQNSLHAEILSPSGEINDIIWS